MKITPTNLTLGQLFTISNEQFYVPAYQRRYAWRKKQLDEFFSDINHLDESNDHLLGTILFLTETHTGSLNFLELIDGQQRITTIAIILKVLKNYFEKADIENTNEIKRYLTCKGSDRQLLNKIKLGDLDNPDFKKIMSDQDLDSIQNTHLAFAYNYFKERVASLGEKIDDFYNKLINRVVIIRLDIGLAKDAYKLFETINNRGLKLSATDVIKNFLLGHASLIGKQTLNLVKSNWRNIIINLDRIDSDKFFRHFMMNKLKVKISGSRLTSEFKNYYYANIKEVKKLSGYRTYLESIGRNDEEESEGEDNAGLPVPVEIEDCADKKISIVDFAKLLKNSSEIYSKIINKSFGNKKINQCLYNLQRIESTPVYTFLLDLFRRKEISDNDKIQILKLLETFMIRRHICEYRTAVLDDIFSKLVGIEGKNIVENVRKQLLKDLPGDKEFVEKFEKSQFRRLEERAKYVLEQIEYDLIKQREYVLGPRVHLEHIIPLTINTKKSIREFGDWPKYLGKDSIEKHKDYVWRIGNLTLLAQELNIAASNNPFGAKLQEYKKSNIKLNKEILRKFKKFKFNEIEKRSAEFAKKAIKLWHF